MTDRFQPIHDFLSVRGAKFSANISLDKGCEDDSQNPTSLATTCALSLTCCMSKGFVHSLFTSCSLLFCFPSNEISHFMYSISLSSAVSFELTLFARYSLSSFRALMLNPQRKRNKFTEPGGSSPKSAGLAFPTSSRFCSNHFSLLSSTSIYIWSEGSPLNSKSILFSTIRRPLWGSILDLVRRQRSRGAGIFAIASAEPWLPSLWADISLWSSSKARLASSPSCLCLISSFLISVTNVLEEADAFFPRFRGFGFGSHFSGS
ncbi:transmembrane amino acid transporter family protein [Striga asiatica]|uniref:Transmembrane amino acid transporter family protein n=1 Tax=Striga asiatica TaxID=4170 RepID=A0A5A7PTL9_STRAF|nr:transmembrane amino acid transporter family protein [Striga asiatica]